MGFIATWSYLIYDILGPAASSGFLGYLLSDTLHSGFGVRVPWWLFAVATFVVIWFFTYYGVRFSMHTTALLGGAEMLIMFRSEWDSSRPGVISSTTSSVQPPLAASSGICSPTRCTADLEFACHGGCSRSRRSW